MGSCSQSQIAPDPEESESWAPETPSCNWKECYDEYGNQYFYNSATQESTYDRPEELVTQERRLNQNYYSLASDFEDREKFCKDEDGNFDLSLKCCLCNKRLCTKVVHPCQHFCLCDRCVQKNNIGPPQLGPRSRQVDSQPRWSMCPICMGEIKRLTGPSQQEIQAYEKFAFNIKSNLPKTFMTKFAYAAHKFRNRKRKKLKTWEVILSSN